MQSGKDATLELRRAGFSSIIIGVTGNSMEDELDEFLKAGADMVMNTSTAMNLKYTIIYTKFHVLFFVVTINVISIM